MNIRIFQQPFDNSGGLSRLGSELTGQLQSGNFNEALIFSAFVTSSGTQRLGPALRAVIQNGGTVRALIGVRNGLTSMQAVADLHAIGVEVWGLDTGGSILYHPKVYLLRGARRGWVSVGSSNLTGDGMYRNIETNTILELSLDNQTERAKLDEIAAWWNQFRTNFRENTRRITPKDVDALVQSGVLANEIAIAREFRDGTRTRANAGRQATDVPRISVPALPPVSGQRSLQRQHRGQQPTPVPSLPTPTPQTRHFAMTLSAHDASKRTGMPGTPELSLPQGATGFFPPMALSGRQYPDAYFDVRLNSGQQASTVEYRIWERPGGTAAGHADLRINIKHDTVDLTTPGGNDIILFEVTTGEAAPQYDVWIISANDPNYQALLARCTQPVAAQGAAAQKRYGFF